MSLEKEKKDAIKQRHADQCAIMAEIMELETMLEGDTRISVCVVYGGERDIPYPELREQIDRDVKKFLNDRLYSMWIAMQEFQNTPIEALEPCEC